MKELLDFLMESLKNSKRLVILGAGSFLKADDAAGVMITEKLRERFGESRISTLKIFTGESAPENFTGEIKKFKPDHLLVLDAADVHEEPGSIAVIDPSVIGGVTFSTHMLPVKVMLDYIKKETGCEITVLGIQPESLTYGGQVTPKVNEAVEYIAAALEKVIVQIS